VWINFLFRNIATATGKQARQAEAIVRTARSLTNMTAADVQSIENTHITGGAVAPAVLTAIGLVNGKP